MIGAPASLPKTRVGGSDLPDPSTAPGEPPVLAAFVDCVQELVNPGWEGAYYREIRGPRHDPDIDIVFLDPLPIWIIGRFGSSSIQPHTHDDSEASIPNLRGARGSRGRVPRGS
jgi:hypothetical protein